MTMGVFRSSLLMFKEMLFPHDSSFKLENILRLVLFLILTPVAVFSTLSLMIVVGSGVAVLQVLVLLMDNTLVDNLLMMLDFITRDLLACRKEFFTRKQTFICPSPYHNVTKDPFKLFPKRAVR